MKRFAYITALVFLIGHFGVSSIALAGPSHGTSAPNFKRPAAPTRSLGVLGADQEQEAIQVQDQQASAIGNAIDSLSELTGSSSHQVGESEANGSDTFVTRELNSEEL